MTKADAAVTTIGPVSITRHLCAAHDLIPLSLCLNLSLSLSLSLSVWCGRGRQRLPENQLPGGNHGAWHVPGHPLDRKHLGL
jgi:hypothetical protein